MFLSSGRSRQPYHKVLGPVIPTRLLRDAIDVCRAADGQYLQFHRLGDVFGLPPVGQVRGYSEDGKCDRGNLELRDWKTSYASNETRQDDPNDLCHRDSLEKPVGFALVFDVAALEKETFQRMLTDPVVTAAQLGSCQGAKFLVFATRIQVASVSVN